MAGSVCAGGLVGVEGSAAAGINRGVGSDRSCVLLPYVHLHYRFIDSFVRRLALGHSRPIYVSNKLFWLLTASILKKAPKVWQEAEMKLDAGGVGMVLAS